MTSGKLGHLNGITAKPAEGDPKLSSWNPEKFLYNTIAYQLSGTCYWKTSYVLTNSKGCIGCTLI